MLKVKSKSNVSGLIEELYAPENVDSAILWEISNKFPQALSEGPMISREEVVMIIRWNITEVMLVNSYINTTPEKIYQSIIKVKIYRG